MQWLLILRSAVIKTNTYVCLFDGVNQKSVLKENNGNEPYKKRNEVWQAATALRQCAIFRVFKYFVFIYFSIHHSSHGETEIRKSDRGRGRRE
jgi:hypothetical protein